MMPGLTYALTAAGGGIVPNATNWADISATDAGSTSATVRGIGDAIQLQATLSSVFRTNAHGTLAVLMNGVSGGSAGIANGNAVVFSIDPDAVVEFDASGNPIDEGSPWSVTATCTIKYKSPGGGGAFDTTLDTFDIVLA